MDAFTSTLLALLLTATAAHAAPYSTFNGTAALNSTSHAVSSNITMLHATSHEVTDSGDSSPLASTNDLRYIIYGFAVIGGVAVLVFIARLVMLCRKGKKAQDGMY